MIKRTLGRYAARNENSVLVSSGITAVLSVEFRVLSEDGNRFYSKLTTHNSKPQELRGRIFTARISRAQLLFSLRCLVWVDDCRLPTGSSSLAGVYDMKKDMELSGSVEKLQFVNPPGSLTLSQMGAGRNTTTWVLTLGSASGLAQRGIGKTGPNALHAGDMIGVAFLPAINGSPLGYLKTVTMPDGRKITISGGQATD
jgi:hypothetical protein